MAKKKSESLNFYPDLFMGGTWRMSLEDRGAYITLLCLSFSERLNLQDIQQVLSTSYDRVWPRISSKFEVDEKGLFFNTRWELEKAQRAAYMERMRENGQKGGRPKKEEKNQQDNQQDNLNQNLNDNHIDRIGYNNISTTEDNSKVSTALAYQGGAGGNGKIPPDFIDSIYADFVAAYGKTKNAIQQFKIQQELLSAVIDCMDRKGVSHNEAGKFLIWCADLANQADTKNRNAYRLAPQNWLAQKCYHSNPLENVVEMAEKETPTQKLARQMAEFQKQHQHKKAQEAGNNGK